MDYVSSRGKIIIEQSAKGQVTKVIADAEIDRNVEQ